MLKLRETNLPSNYSTAMYNEKGYDIAAEHTSIVADILFTGVTTCLADIKKKEYPTAFVFEQNDGAFVAGAVVEYMANEDDKSKPGSWSYYWSWNKDDIPSNARISRVTDSQISQYFRAFATSKYGINYRDLSAINETLRFFLVQLDKWLDENASETEEIGIEEEGIFQARVAVEDGVKVKSLEVDGEVKKLIKDDSAIEA